MAPLTPKAAAGQLQRDPYERATLAGSKFPAKQTGPSTCRPHVRPREAPRTLYSTELIMRRDTPMWTHITTRRGHETHRRGL